jgi:hypothetical protein
MEARQCVVFTGDSGSTSRKGGIGRTSSGEAAAARLGEGSSALCLAGPIAERHDLEAAARRAWQGQCPSVRLGGLAVVCSEAGE